MQWFDLAPSSALLSDAGTLGRRAGSYAMVALVVLLALSPAAQAARPFVTDDARLTTAGSCQLETWTRQYRSSQEYWALPACNPTGNLELTLGGGAARLADSSGWTDDYALQAKTLFRTLETNGWGIGLAAGTIRHPKVNPGPNLLGNVYVYAPLSMSFADDLLIVHVNGGWLHDKATAKQQGTWGLGTELNLNQRWTLIAESYGNTVDTPYWQSGFRYSVIPGLFQIDTTLGRQYGNNRDARWLSFGIRYTPSQLF
jgi:hypothetical protein